MRPFAPLLACILLAGCLDDPETVLDPRFDFPVPLTDIKANKYLVYQGGLYPGGSNDMPADHATEGRRRATLVQPRFADGTVNQAGKIVLLSVGFDNASEEFCSQDGKRPCNAWSFTGQAEAYPDFDRDDVALVNGAIAGGFVDTWDAPTDANYDRIRDQLLTPAGLSEKQVQVVWMKMSTQRPPLPLPGFTSDAFTVAQRTADAVRALHVRYPNLQMVFLSSRIYGGFALVPTHPEPYAFETGYATKWVIETQIQQMRGGTAPHSVPTGNLSYPANAPWIAWGPYLWSGLLSNKRSDGLFWEAFDFEGDGFHPSNGGEAKVAGMLMEFFTTSPHTRCWFLSGQTCS
jgi:hypothetical protein